MSLLKYPTAFTNWTKRVAEYKRKTKLIRIYSEVHPKSHVDRLYVPRKEKGEVWYTLAIRD